MSASDELQLPKIPDPFLPQYVFSGKIPGSSIPILLLGGALGIAIVGPLLATIGTMIFFLIVAVYRYIDHGLVKLALTFCLLLYPIILSVIAGVVMALYNRAIFMVGRIRNLKLINAFSFLTIFLGISVFPRVIQELSSGGMLGERFAALTAEWWSYLVFGVSALIAGISGVAMVNSMLRETPYCETCHKWYRPIGKARLSFDTAESLIRYLQPNDPGLVDNAPTATVAADHFPHLLLQIKRCSNGCSGMHRIDVMHCYKFKSSSKAQAPNVEKRKAWFGGMVEAGIGGNLAKSIIEI
jgi:hypothetical protein